MSDQLSLENAIATLPLTAHLKVTTRDSQKISSSGNNTSPTAITGMHTIQSCVNVLEFVYFNKDGEKDRIQVSQLPHVYFARVYSNKIYKTFTELFKSWCKKDHGKTKPKWIVCLATASSQGIQIRCGQMFKILKFSKNSYFYQCLQATEDRTRKVKISLYPSKQTIWLPITTKGDFRECDSPSSMQRESITNIGQANDLPLLVTTDNVGKSKNVPLCLLSFAVEKVLISSVKAAPVVDTKPDNRNVDLEIHVFPMKDATLTEIFTSLTPVDVLSDKDLKRIRGIVLENGRYQNHIRYSYNEFGIKRADNISAMSQRKRAAGQRLNGVVTEENKYSRYMCSSIYDDGDDESLLLEDDDVSDDDEYDDVAKEIHSDDDADAYENATVINIKKRIDDTVLLLKHTNII